MPSKHLIKWVVIPTLSLLISANGAVALQGDLSQGINTESDQVEWDEQKLMTTLTGKVVITQGSIRIEADKVTVQWVFDPEANKNVIKDLTCNGSPALFQQADAESGLVVGKASTIFYDHTNEKVELTKDANLSSEDGSQMSSDSIMYDLSTGGMSAGKNERVKTVFPPQKQKEEKDGDS